jgi:GT2 family glycosyltransferase
LRQSLPALLALTDVMEVVVVDDGSRDGTADFLAQQRDPRLSIVTHVTAGGQPAARNSGSAAASGTWVLFGEDDCWFPPDYATVLGRVARSLDVDVVGAPWLNLPTYGDRETSPRTATAGAALSAHPSLIPEETVETPFIPATALVRRSVIDDLGFDTGYRGNAYREETDFFVRAVRRGYRCVLTPATASYQLGQWTGGARIPRLRYEYWLLRNNWRFLRRHGRWLAQNGYAPPALAAQITFAGNRAVHLVAGFIQARLRAEIAGG